MTVNPYLYFDGNCEEAFNFYKSVFGGDFTNVGRFNEMPADFPIPEEAKNRVMHVSLPLSDGQIIMGSDTMQGHGPGANAGTNMAISISPDSEAQANELFNGLSAGGQVTFPIQKTFWGAFFGSFTDKYGINWMVNYLIPKD